MVDTYTARSGLVLQEAGSNLNVWGDPKLNNNFQKTDFAVKGMVSFALSGSKTLTSSNTSITPADIESTAAMINVTGGTGGTVTVPSRQGTWAVRNNSTGNVTFTTGSGGTAVIAAGDFGSVLCDGTNCYAEMRRNFAGNRLTNVGSPTSDTDAATKAYADNLAFSSSLPNQAGNSGRFLTTNGTSASWATVFPSFSGTNGYILTSNGSASVWSTPAATRTALGLGGAAVLNVGTGSGTVAAGDDSRIVNAVQPGSSPTFGGMTIAAGTPVIDFNDVSETTQGRLNFSASIGAFQFSIEGAAYFNAFIVRPSNSTAQLFGNEIYTTGNLTIANYALLASPAFTGTPTAPTASTATNTTQIATTAYVKANLASYLTTTTAASTYAPIASPTFTGTPSIGAEKLMRIATGTAANSGRVSFGTGAPGTLALGEVFLQHSA